MPLRTRAETVVQHRVSLREVEKLEAAEGFEFGEIAGDSGQEVRKRRPDVVQRPGEYDFSSAADAAKYGIPYPYPGFSGTVASALRQYPQIRANNTITDYAAPLGFSTYNSLQITVNKRLSKGLNVYADYVWSKAMSNGAGSVCSGCGANAGPLDYYNLKLEKAPVSYNQPKVFKAYVNYQLPLGRGRGLLPKMPKAVDAVVGGWAMAWIVNYASGAAGEVGAEAVQGEDALHTEDGPLGGDVLQPFEPPVEPQRHGRSKRPGGELEPRRHGRVDLHQQLVVHAADPDAHSGRPRRHVGDSGTHQRQHGRAGDYRHGARDGGEHRRRHVSRPPGPRGRGAAGVLQRAPTTS